MKYLLDTNIVSELISKQPNQKVLDFLYHIEEDKIFLSVVTIGEIKAGIEKLEDGIKKEKLISWLGVELLNYYGLFNRSYLHTLHPSE